MRQALEFQPSPLEDITKQMSLAQSGIRLLLKRDDLLDREISGNKARKLKYNMAEILDRGRPTVVTFGGAYSNHLLAVAVAGQRFGFRTVGIVRGEEHLPLNAVLRIAKDNGMLFQYLDREAYRHKDHPDTIAAIKTEWGENSFVIPEGGANCLGVQGAAEIIPEIEIPFDVICSSCGTGATLAGIVSSLPPGARALGFSALKGGEFLRDEVARLLESCGLEATGPWDIDTEFHFGGFAKRPPELLAFVKDFEKKLAIRLDPIYEGKMMFGVMELIKRGHFPTGATIVCLQAGGYESSGLRHSSGSL